MADFFAQDFNEEKWQKAALKNAFVLMSKQRFVHAAAFFLLAGSLSDAVQVGVHECVHASKHTCVLQTLVSHVNDLQMAIVVVRLYESSSVLDSVDSADAQKPGAALRQLLCNHVLNISTDALSSLDDTSTPRGSCPDPFTRSMAFWLLREHSRAAQTLLHQAINIGGARTSESDMGATGKSADGATYSNIFYFYTYLRAQPIVLRQRLADDGIVVAGGTERLLHMTRMMERRVTVAERRLYFKTAQTHLKRGCALLSLDVLCRLPRHLCFSLPHTAAPPADAPVPKVSITVNAALSVNAKADSFDWGAPLATDVPSKRPAGLFIVCLAARTC
jgi:hypothetical protein